MNFILAASLLSSLFAADAWQGFLYPNRDDLTLHLLLGSFASLEECRAAATAIVNEAGWQSPATWECGLNCKEPTSEFDLWVCEETSD